MAEAGGDISGQASIRVTAGMIEAADLAVTVCGQADEHCPVLPAGSRKEHWPLEDPAKDTGTGEKIMVAFQATREAVRGRVEGLIDQLERPGDQTS